MEIFLLKQEINRDYGTYNSVVVIAENEEEARKIHPSRFVTHVSNNEWMGTFSMGQNKGVEYRTWDNKWVRFDQIGELIVTHVGTATAEQKKGVLLSSFNAG